MAHVLIWLTNAIIQKILYKKIYIWIIGLVKIWRAKKKKKQVLLDIVANRSGLEVVASEIRS